MRLESNAPYPLVALFALLVVSNRVEAQSIRVTPEIGLAFEAQADSFSLGNPQAIGVSPLLTAGEKIPFKFGAIVPVNPTNAPTNFIVVSPSSGVTPALLWVRLNSNVVPYMPAGTYVVWLQFATPGQSCPPCSGIFITLRLRSGPDPRINSVVNAATLQPGISPGAIVSILGSNLGTAPITAQYNSAGFFPTDLSGRQYRDFTTARDGVTFNGIPAALLYVSQNQINAVVPYGVAGQSTANIVITHNLAASPPLAVPIADTSPGIFTATQNGTGQGAILNEDSRVNSVDNPAPKGSIIQIFGTGAGVWNRNPQDGSVVVSAIVDFTTSGTVLLRPLAPVSVSIGGQPATVLYAGAAPNAVSGALQVNAVVPAGIGSGPQQVVLTVGGNNNVQQQVTVAVQ